MWIIMKNNWRRLMQRKWYLIISIILTVVCVAAAIAFSGNKIIKSNVAWVSLDGTFPTAELDSYRVVRLEKAPQNYQLLTGRYDAIVISEDGVIEIRTYKNEKYKETLQKAVKDPSTFYEEDNGKRGVGTNVIGYVIMVLLMQGFLYGRLFAEDIETHMIKRIAVSSFTFKRYLAGNAFFICAIIFIPSYLTIISAALLKFEIVLSLLQYGFFIFLISLLSTAFCLFLEAYVKGTGNANTLGSSLIVLTSVLGGCFRAIDDSDNIINKVLNIIPQKDLIDFVDAFEKQYISITSWIQLTYVILLSIIFLYLAIAKLNRENTYKV